MSSPIKNLTIKYASDCVITPTHIITRNPTKIIINGANIEIIGRPPYIYPLYYAWYLLKWIISFVWNCINSNKLKYSFDKYDDYYVEHFLDKNLDFNLESINIADSSNYRCRQGSFFSDNIDIVVSNSSNFTLMDIMNESYSNIQLKIDAGSSAILTVPCCRINKLNAYISNNSKCCICVSKIDVLILDTRNTSKCEIRALKNSTIIDNLNLKSSNDSQIIFDSVDSKKDIVSSAAR